MILYKEESVINEEMKNYEMEGNVTENVGAIIYLAIGVGIAILVTIFVSVIGGKSVTITQDDINNISDVNVKASVNNAIQKSFVGLETNADFMPLVVLLTIMGLMITGLVGGFMGGRGGGYGGGGYYGGL